MVYASHRPSLEWNGSRRTQLGYLAVTWGRRQETAVRQIDLLCAPQAMAATVLAAVPNGGSGAPKHARQSHPVIWSAAARGFRMTANSAVFVRYPVPLGGASPNGPDSPVIPRSQTRFGETPP
jgi:hypothetical protein